MRNKVFYVVIFLVLIASAIYFYFEQKNKKTVEVTIKNSSFRAEISDSEKERSLGLGHRESLCRKCAMLFVFPEAGEHGFWMKNMNFDLDILWIKDNKIVFIKKSFSKDSKETVWPNVLADKVLEINAGISDSQGFIPGDEVDIN